jgi:hypothetical protein
MVVGTSIDQQGNCSQSKTRARSFYSIDGAVISHDMVESIPGDSVGRNYSGSDTSREDHTLAGYDALSEIPREMIPQFVISTLMTEKMCFNEDPRKREYSLIFLARLFPDVDMCVTNEMVRAFVRDLRVRLDTRIPGYDDRKHPGSEAVLGCLDTEGWGSLETSLKGLRIILRSVIIDNSSDLILILDVISGSIRHKNRYAREQGHLCFAEILRCHDVDEVVHAEELLMTGLGDNWSQVRYASLIALKSYLRRLKRLGFSDAIGDDLITHILINRHYPAEGVRRLAQEVWRVFTGPQGGRGILIPRIVQILDNLSLMIESDNHSVREAIVSVGLELVNKVFPHVVDCKWNIGCRGIKLCIYGLEDDAWFIRQVAIGLTSVLFDTILTNISALTCEQEFLVSNSERILDLLLLDTASSIPCLQEESTRAIISLLSWQLKTPNQVLITKVLSVIQKVCASDDFGESLARSSGNYDCRNSHEDQVMYSCGSLMSNRDLRRSAKHSTSDECCSTLGPVYKPDFINILTGMLGVYFAILEHPTLSVHRDVKCVGVTLSPLVRQLTDYHSCNALQKLSIKIDEKWTHLISVNDS